MTELPKLEFSVRYRLWEYLDVVTEHSFATEDALRSLTGIKRILAMAALRTISTLMFLYKSFRIGQCHFKIDSTGISRRSNGEDGSVSWSKVKALHTYTSSYLVDLQDGAMPIPFRVLRAEQVQLLQTFAGELILQDPQPNNSFKPNLLRKSA